MWEIIVTHFKDFCGTGMIIALFLAAILYLLIAEKRKEIRILLIYVPLTVLGLFLCPLFAAVMYRFVGEEIYYRVFWLLPILPVVSYAGVKVLKELQGRLRIAAGILMSVIIMLCGDFVYDNIYFSGAQNPYHVPQSVVDICDEMVVEGREIMAVVPVELLQYVRQYAPTVCMPYGREITVERWNVNSPLYDAMEAPVMEAAALASWAEESQCHYVVVKKEKEINGTMEDYGFLLQKEVDGYVIYRNTHMYFGLWDEE